MSGIVQTKGGVIVTGTTVGSKEAMDVFIHGGAGPLDGLNWDYCDVQQTSATVDTYVFKTGGSGGSTVKTCVVTYVDASKADLDTVVFT